MADFKNSEKVTQLYKEVCGFVEPHVLTGLKENTPILIALSGGADSSFLLRILASYAEEHKTRLACAHINHCIRGKEADSDENFCRELAKQYNVEFFSLRADVPSLAEKSGRSIETEARLVRYNFFAKIMKEQNIKVLATAHNADDNLETMIFNLARGSGLNGLCGIPKVRDCEGGIIIRPILNISKSEILAFCHAHGFSYVTDSTNKDTNYSRNRIRCNIIPELEKIVTSPQHSALKASELLKKDEEYLTGIAENFVKEHCKDERSIDLAVFNALPQPIAFRVLRSVSAKNAVPSLEYVHYCDIISLAARAVPHSSVSLKAGFCAEIENSSLIFKESAQKQLRKNTDTSYFQADLKEGIIENPENGFMIIVGKTSIDNFNKSGNKFTNIYNLSTEMHLKCDKIIGHCFFRLKNPSDVIYVNRLHKKLRKIFNEKNVHPSLRSRIPLLCDDEGIVWAPFCCARDDTYYFKCNSEPEKDSLHIKILLSDTN